LIGFSPVALDKPPFFRSRQFARHYPLPPLHVLSARPFAACHQNNCILPAGDHSVDNHRRERFGVDPEITAKIARKGCRIYEVGISYHGRTYGEGKKITWKDGVRALYCILKYNLFW
jgi:hypothetical protein